MSVERVSLDSNILFYAIDVDAGERCGKARQVVRRAALEFDCILTLQSLGEFFAATTGKSKLTVAAARDYVENWQSVFPVVAAVPESLRRALLAVERHKLSFWDAMQWAVAKQAGVRLFISEDFQHERQLQDVRFRNPFLMEDPFEGLPAKTGR